MDSYLTAKLDVQLIVILKFEIANEFFDPDLLQSVCQDVFHHQIHLFSHHLDNFGTIHSFW